MGLARLDDALAKRSLRARFDKGFERVRVWMTLL